MTQRQWCSRSSRSSTKYSVLSIIKVQVGVVVVAVRNLFSECNPLQLTVVKFSVNPNDDDHHLSSYSATQSVCIDWPAVKQQQSRPLSSPGPVYNEVFTKLFPCKNDPTFHHRPGGHCLTAVMRPSA